MQIYLDYCATTPPRSEVIATMQRIMLQDWGNPSSLHAWGQRSSTVIEIARTHVAQLINAPTIESLVFTSGGTEANNLAIMGVAWQYQKPQHLIISSVEHSAISEPAKFLEQRGWQITRLPVNHQGRINPLDLKAAMQTNTVLVSVIYGQSEIGTLQPIAELARIAHYQGVLFHTDAVQVAGRLPIDVQHLDVDLLSISSHKIYGPQGAGGLYVRPGVELYPLLTGGGQEMGHRSGTQAVPTIAGFGLAAELAAREMETETPRLIRLRDHLYDLLGDCPHLIPTGDRHNRLPHHLSFIVKEKITGKNLVRQLNLAGIGISGGAACNSGKLTPSGILLAMGYKPEDALGGIRLSLGRDTTEADLNWVAMAIKQILNRLIPALVLSK